jgi:hypothetical protein
MRVALERKESIVELRNAKSKWRLCAWFEEVG